MRLFVILLFALALITTHAHANTATAPSRSVLDKVADALKNPAKARKIFNPTGIAAQFAFGKLMEGIDYVMNEGAEAQKKDREANKNEVNNTDRANFPFEYVSPDGESFSSPEDLRSYILGNFLTKRGLKRTRQDSGLYYDKMVVDYNNYNVLVWVQAGPLNSSYQNNVGGSVVFYSSKIYKVGTISDKQIIRDDEQAEKERKRKIIERLARQYEADLAEAEANNPPSDKEKEQDETKDKPKTGTGTATQAGTGAGTADNTATNTKDETEATAQSGTGTKKDDKDNKEKDKEPPKFCEYAKTVCDFIDWAKKDSNDKDTELDIPEPKTPTIDTNIRFNGQCPADMIISGNIFGQQISFTLFEWTKFCEILAMIKPIIIAMASYGAFKIVGGVNVAD